MAGKITKQKIDREQCLISVSALIKARCSYREIRDKLGISLGCVHKYVHEIMARWREEQVDNIHQQMLIDLACLDDAIKAITIQYRAGDLSTIDRLVKLLERRAKMLGLDAPQKIAPTTPDGTQEFGKKGLQAFSTEELAQMIAARTQIIEADSGDTDTDTGDADDAG